MSETRIIFQVLAKGEYTEDVLALLHQLVDGTRKEDGNISFDMYQDDSLDMRYIIGGSWKTQESFDLHMKSKNYSVFKDQVRGKIDDLEINIFRKIY